MQLIVADCEKHIPTMLSVIHLWFVNDIVIKAAINIVFAYRIEFASLDMTVFGYR